MEQVLQLTKAGLPFLLVLIAPGYVYRSAKQFIIGQDPAPLAASEWIGVVIRSMAIMAVTTLIMSLGGYASMVYGMAERPLVSSNVGMLFGGGWQEGLAVLMTFVVMPAGYGALVGAGQRQGWSLKTILKKQFANRAQPSDQAIDQAIWDAVQRSKVEQKNLVIGVRLDGQAVVYGLYGGNSKISESGGYRDLYLEETWQMGEDGILAPSPDASSIFIKGSTINALVFFLV